MPIYHFSVGNSTDGHIGLCAEVSATSPEEAIDRLRDGLPYEVPVKPWPGEIADHGIGYICVFINLDALTYEDIDEVRDADDDYLVRGG